MNEGMNGFPSAINPFKNAIAGSYYQRGCPEFSTTSTTDLIVYSLFIQQSGTYRVSFNIRISSGSAAYGRVYKNGVAVGVERTAGAAAVTFVEDFPFAQGDRVQFAIRSGDSADTAYGKDFKLGNNDRLVAAPIPVPVIS